MKSKIKLPSYLLYKRLLADGVKLVNLENKEFSSILMNYAWKIIELIIHRDKKVTTKLRVFWRFTRYLVYLNEKHGALYTVKYLKASLLAIQKVIAGTPLSSLREVEPDLNLPRLASCGLPAWIGTRDRRAILSSSKSVVQFYLSLYSLYRVIDAPVKANLSTISDAYSGSEQFLLESLGFFEFKFKKLIGVPKLKLSQPRLLSLESSSPSQQLFSWKGWGWDAFLIRQDRALWSHFSKWLELVNSPLRTVLRSSLKTEIKSGREFSDQEPLQVPGSAIAPTGRLSFKKEAAGKLRIFAMVDVWTQSIMKPLHDSLFQLLEKIPNDATFDQDAAFKRAISKSKESGHCFGYDLSSATDRLPIALQVSILRGLIGPHLAELWRLILVGRDYYLPKNSYEINQFSIRYSVGQPMGALSSWAMLALCHHAIVQYAHRLIGGRKWTTAYEVLGDDIVIFDPHLAAKYVELMSLYGVGLNMAKSVISIKKIPVVEFAKRTSLNGSDVSPISMKMFLNQDSFAGRIAIFDWYRSRINSHYFSALKTIMKSVRWDDRPLKDSFVLLGVFSTQIRKGFLPLEWLLRNFNYSKMVLKRVNSTIKIENFSPDYIFKVLNCAFKGGDRETCRPLGSMKFDEDRRWYKTIIICRIFKLSLLTKKTLDYYVNRYLLVSQLTNWRDFGSFLMLRSRYPASCCVREDIQKAYDFLFDQAYADLCSFTIGELLEVLEQAESAASLLTLVDKEKRVAKKAENNLKSLQWIDSILKTGFKEKACHQFLWQFMPISESYTDFLLPTTGLHNSILSQDPEYQ